MEKKKYSRGGYKGHKGGDGQNVRLSKTLSMILRHQGVKLGLKMTPEGYVLIDDLLKLEIMQKFHPTIEMIQAVVNTNDKKRFEISLDGTMIRAVQGHTIEDVKEEGLMEAITDPAKYPIVIHGSYAKNWHSIYENGLSKMKRNHIHMAIGYPKDQEVISGMRNTCNLFIELDLEKAMKDGIKFFESKNKVILSSGINGVIPRKYFKKVILDKKVVYAGEEDKPLNYLLVLDFEANCVDKEDTPLKVQEIIEFPVVLVDAKGKKIIDTFHRYIKPVAEPKLSKFCTELTGITQEMVAKGVLLTEAIKELGEFLTKNKVPLEEAVVVTCGDWDIRTCLRKEAAIKKIVLPEYLKKWINLKKVFTPTGVVSKDLGAISKAHPVVSGMVEMLEKMGLPLVGRHHSGIDDAKNIAQVVLKMLEKGFEFKREFIDFI